MRQFDIVRNPDPGEAVERPYLVVLQSDLVAGLRSAVVAPLVARAAMEGASRLNPLITVETCEYWFAVHELFAIDRRVLGEAVGSAAGHRDQIIAALDLLFTGF
jgi:toxin CcdB